jgi:rod shape-determining protein MreB
MFLNSILGRAIDLGTANTLVYVKGKGVIINEPSVVAISKNGRNKNDVLAVGNDAKLMLGRTPGNIVAIRPMKDGVIADFSRLTRPRIIICVPSGITAVERRAVREAAESAGAREVFFIEEPMAAAIGAGLPVTEPTCSMVVDIGGGTTEVAVISLAGIVFSRSVKVGGNHMDEAILQHVKKKFNLLIGDQTAELVKTTIGNAFANNKVEHMDIKGRDLVSGVPKIIGINSDEVREAISDQLQTIIETVQIALEQTPPELAGDVVEEGIMLSGGGALLKNLDKLLYEETGLPIAIADDPLSNAVTGSGKALDSFDTLRELMV